MADNILKMMMMKPRNVEEQQIMMVQCSISHYNSGAWLMECYHHTHTGATIGSLDAGTINTCVMTLFTKMLPSDPTFSRHIPLYFMFGIETCVVIKWILSGSGRNFSKCLCHPARPSCYPGLSAVTKIPKCSHNSNVYIHQNTNQQSRWSIMKIIRIIL